MKSYAQEFRDQYTAGTRPSMQFGRKRDRLNFGSVPMKGKRRRMASRQRVVSPFVVTGTMQAQFRDIWAFPPPPQSI